MKINFEVEPRANDEAEIIQAETATQDYESKAVGQSSPSSHSIDIVAPEDGPLNERLRELYEAWLEARRLKEIAWINYETEVAKYKNNKTQENLDNALKAHEVFWDYQEKESAALEAYLEAKNASSK